MTDSPKQSKRLSRKQGQETPIRETKKRASREARSRRIPVQPPENRDELVESASGRDSKRNIMESVTQIAKDVRIQRVIQPSFEARALEPASLGVADLGPLDVRPTQSARWHREGATLVVRLRMQLELIASDSESALCRVRSEYVLLYALSDELEPRDEDLDSFALINGCYNAWSYWREFVQSSLARLEMPMVTVPTFRPDYVL